MKDEKESEDSLTIYGLLSESEIYYESGFKFLQGTHENSRSFKSPLGWYVLIALIIIQLLTDINQTLSILFLLIILLYPSISQKGVSNNMNIKLYSILTFIIILEQHLSGFSVVFGNFFDHTLIMVLNTILVILLSSILFKLFQRFTLGTVFEKSLEPVTDDSKIAYEKFKDHLKSTPYDIKENNDESVFKVNNILLKNQIQFIIVLVLVIFFINYAFWWWFERFVTINGVFENYSFLSMSLLLFLIFFIFAIHIFQDTNEEEEFVT
jgi:hypothetical protein